MRPETRYALSGDVHIAYQVVGDGPFDLIFVPGFVTHADLQWRLPGMGDFLRTLGSFSRLIRFDKRGTGMSDPVSGAPSLETRMDDVRAVMDAVGSRRAAFYGLSEGAAMSILFAATYPERTAALVIRSCSPRTMWAPDFPWGRREEVFGDRHWRELLERHHMLVRRELLRFRGREIDTSGDGFFATFDGPARAIRCACAIVAGMRELGVSIRAGLHTGECEMTDGKVAGIAVHTGARVAAQADADEVLVSHTVKDLVAGSGLEFTDRGAHELKGIPGEWRLFAVDRGT